MTRDYSLLGPDGARAVETGLAAAEWYHTEVPRKVMKDLMAQGKILHWGMCEMGQKTLRRAHAVQGFLGCFERGAQRRQGNLAFPWAAFGGPIDRREDNFVKYSNLRLR